jgi:Bacterial PH domain
MGSGPAGRKKRADVTDGTQTFRSPTAVVIWWVWLLFAAANLVDLAVQGRDHLSLIAAATLLLATGVAYVTAQRPRIVADSSGLTVVNPLRDHHIGWAGVTNVDLADLLRVHYRAQGRDKVISAWAVHYSRRRKLTAENKARRQADRASSGRSGFGGFGLGSSGGGYGTRRRDLGYGSPSGTDTTSAEAEAERIARILNERATAARAETVWAEGTVEIAGASPPAQPGPEPGPEPAGSEAAGPEPASAIETAGDAATDPRLAGWLEPLTSTWDRKALLALLVPALILLIVALV